MVRYKHHLWVQNVASAMTSAEQGLGLINSRILSTKPNEANRQFKSLEIANIMQITYFKISSNKQ